MPPASNLIFSGLALADLDDIATYTLVRWSDAQLVKYLQKFDDTWKVLLAMPEIGRKRLDISEHHRSIAVEHHVVFYYLKNNDLHISRIVHGHMDVSKHVIP